MYIVLLLMVMPLQCTVEVELNLCNHLPSNFVFHYLFKSANFYCLVLTSKYKMMDVFGDKVYAE